MVQCLSPHHHPPPHITQQLPSERGFTHLHTQAPQTCTVVTCSPTCSPGGRILATSTKTRKGGEYPTTLIHPYPLLQRVLKSPPNSAERFSTGGLQPLTNVNPTKKETPLKTTRKPCIFFLLQTTCKFRWLTPSRILTNTDAE